MATIDIEKNFQEAEQEALSWLSAEISSLRSNRVQPDIVESILVESYGARSPLNSLASVSSTDARTLVIAPWDAGTIPDIEKAITNANIGVQPVVDNEVIRLSFPSLTDEVRQQTIKTLHSKAEEARVRLRKSRDEILKDLKQSKEKGDSTEDDFHDGRKQLDELIGAANQEIEALAKAKEEELSSI